MKKIIYTLSLLLTSAFMASCMSDADYDDLKAKLDKNATDINPIEVEVDRLNIQFQSLKNQYEALDKKLIASSVKDNGDNTYTITYEDGKTVTLRQAFNPLVEIKEGYVWINNVNTNLKKYDGADASISLSIDPITGEYLLKYTVKGVETTVSANVKPIEGDTGKENQAIEIKKNSDGNYYYYVNNVDTGIRVNPTDGKTSTVTIITENDKQMMVITDIDGTVSKVPLPEKGDKGDQGVQGDAGREIQAIVVDGYKLGFTYPGEPTQFTEFVTRPLILEVVAPVDFTTAAPTQTLNFTLLSQTTELNASVELYKVPQGWNVKVNKTAAKEGTLEIAASSDAVAGSLMLMAIDDKDNNYMRRIELKYVP